MRYDTLDILRGVAAIAVLLFHLKLQPSSPSLVPHGYLAVDFFFMMSGFVLAHGYEQALQTRLPWRTFLIMRVIRLYPLALLGAGMGLAVLSVSTHAFPQVSGSTLSSFAGAALNCFMLPSPLAWSRSAQPLYPADIPLWTLALEFGINLLWAWAGPRMSTVKLAAFALASWVVVAILTMQAGTADLGYDAATLWGGVARVCFGFPLGVVLYRLRHDVGFIPRPPPWLLALALAVVVTGPAGDTAGVPWWDLASLLVFLPAIILLGGHPRRVSWPGRWLGATSYPIYALHTPVLALLSGLNRMLKSPLGAAGLAVLTFVAVVGVGVAAWRLYDEPARRYLVRVARKRGWLVPRLEPRQAVG